MAGHLQNENPNVTSRAPTGKHGSKFVTVLVTGNSEQQVHMEGYQVSSRVLQNSNIKLFFRILDSLKSNKQLFGIQMFNIQMTSSSINFNRYGGYALTGLSCCVCSIGECLCWMNVGKEKDEGKVDDDGDVDCNRVEQHITNHLAFLLLFTYIHSTCTLLCNKCSETLR